MLKSSLCPSSAIKINVDFIKGPIEIEFGI